MAPQIYLITPADTDSATLMAVLNAAEVSALLVPRGGADAARYAEQAKGIINIGQGAGCAVLLENDAALAKRLGADGVHVSDGIEALDDAVLALKPSFIVGAGSAKSRHDAMTMGEANVDYVFFGPLDGALNPEARELAEWWASTFEIPAVLSDPAAIGPDIDSAGAEFLALSASIWNAASPAQAMRAIAQALGEPA